MQKRFFSSLALSLFLNLLIKPFSVLVIDAGVQRVLGNEVYGNYFVLLSLTLVFNIFLDLGLNNYTTREIAKDESKLAVHVSRIVYLRLILFGVYILLVCSTALLIGIGKESLQVLGLLIINQFVIQSIAFIRSIFSGLHRFNIDTIISVLDRLLLICMVGWALVFNRDLISPFSFVLAQTVGYFITLVVALILLSKNLHKLKLTWEPHYVSDVLKKSIPFAVLVLLMLLYNRSDVVLLKQLSRSGDFQAGIYAQGYRLLDALYMLGMIFAGLLYPVFSRMIHRENQEIGSLIQVSGKLLIGGSLGIMILSVSNADYLLNLIYGPQVTPQSISVFSLLMVGFFFMSFNFIFGTLLTAKGALRLLNLISLGGVIVSVSMNIFLIPKFGAMACAYVTILTQAVVSFLLLIISKINLNQNLSLRSWLLLIGFGLLTFAITQLLIRLNINQPLVFILDIGLIFCSSLLFSVIDFRSLKKIWQLNESGQ